MEIASANAGSIHSLPWFGVTSAKPTALARRSGSTRKVQERGTTSIEVVLCLMLLVTIWFSLAQLTLLGVGGLVVQHAAHRAARAAIVILDDDPGSYNDAPRQDLRARSEARLSAVRKAAYAPLSVLAPSLGDLGQSWRGSSTLESALESGLASTASSYFYNPIAAAVVLERAGEPADSFGIHEDVTAHVGYLFNCRVPLARSLVCKSLSELLADKGISKLLDQVESPSQQQLLKIPGQYFLVLEGRETLPNQGARYHKAKGDS
jgi:hypothetical protein